MPDRSAEEREAVAAFDAALAELEKLQTDDFAGLFRAMDGLPVVIRLIDPPLHEFLPSHEELHRRRHPPAHHARAAPMASLGVDAGLVQQGLAKLFGTKDAARAMRKLGLIEARAGPVGRRRSIGPRSRPSWPRRRSCSRRSRRCASRTRCSACAACGSG